MVEVVAAFLGLFSASIFLAHAVEACSNGRADADLEKRASCWTMQRELGHGFTGAFQQVT